MMLPTAWQLMALIDLQPSLLFHQQQQCIQSIIHGSPQFIHDIAVQATDKTTYDGPAPYAQPPQAIPPVEIRDPFNLARLTWLEFCNLLVNVL